MPYEIKPSLWGIKPGKRETRQRVITGLNGRAISNPEVILEPPYFTFNLKRQIIDSVSQTFISPNMQVRDFKPFAKELIDTGTTVLDSSKGKFFMWSMPPFSFEINQMAGWSFTRCNTKPLVISASKYDVLLTPYIFLTEDITRLSLNNKIFNGSLAFRLSYTCLEWKGTTYVVDKMFCRCSEAQMLCRQNLTSDDYYSLQQSVDYSNWSATNCTEMLTLSQLLGVETQEKFKNGFYIQYGGGALPSLVSNNQVFYTSLSDSIFQEGQSSIRARVFLPELFAPIADQPAILTTSAPIISGCIVRFVKNVV